MGPKWQFKLLAVTTVGLVFGILSLDGEYGRPEVAILTFGVDYAEPEIAILTFGGDHGGPEVAI